MNDKRLETDTLVALNAAAIEKGYAKTISTDWLEHISDQATRSEEPIFHSVAWSVLLIQIPDVIRCRIRIVDGSSTATLFLDIDKVNFDALADDDGT